MTESNPTGQPPNLPAFDIPDRIGDYTILDILGEGGMGAVYLAEEQDPTRRVALKVIKPGVRGETALQRFEFEQQTLAQMNHDAIARVYRTGTTENGRPYFAMELVAGSPIDEFCEGMELPLIERLQLFGRVCEGVQHAHENGVVHRDLKPANILIAHSDDQPTPKIIDFGIARALERAPAATVTQAGQWVGTPAYMAPEQLDPSLGGVGVRTDVYALGATLYRVLTGRLPFPALFDGGLADAQRRLLEQDPSPLWNQDEAHEMASRLGAPPAQLRRAFRHELQWILTRCLEKDPRRRYGSAREIARDLERFVKAEPVHAGPRSVGYRLERFVARNRKGLLATAAAMAVAILGATFGLWEAADAATRVEAALVKETLADARLAMELGNWELAISQYEELAKSDPQHGEATVAERLQAYFGAGDTDALARELRSLDEASPTLRGWPSFYRGVLANRGGNPEAGLDSIRRAVELGGLGGVERAIAASLLAKTFDDALAAADRAFEENPRHRLAVWLKASLLFMAGLEDDARDFARILPLTFHRDERLALSLDLIANASTASNVELDRLRDRVLESPRSDASFTAAVRVVSTVLKLTSGHDDLIVATLYDEVDGGTGWTIAAVAKAAPLLLELAAAPSHTQVRAYRDPSLIHPCVARGWRRLPGLIPAMIMRTGSWTEEEVAEFRTTMRTVADETGLSLFRYMSAFFYREDGDYELALRELDRAERGGQLVPVRATIRRERVRASLAHWNDRRVDSIRRRDLGKSVIAALGDATRDPTFLELFEIACAMEDASVLNLVLDAWFEARTDGSTIASDDLELGRWRSIAAISTAIDARLRADPDDPWLRRHLTDR